MTATVGPPAGSVGRRQGRAGGLLFAVCTIVVVSLAPTAPAWAAPRGISGVGPGPYGSTERCSTPTNEMVRDTPWTHQRLALARVHALTTGQGTVTAVIDTGVDGKVPQLAGRVLPGVDVINGKGTADTDCYGHGTFVAGIIAAQPRPGTGVVGAAPGTMILPVRQANNSSDGTSSGLAKSIRVAADQGAKVINMSASSFFPADDLHAAVQYAAAKDVLLVGSASNQAQAGNPKAYPAAYPEVMAVGAIGRDGRRTDFSEVGDYLSLVAPGVEVISLSRGAQGHLMDNGTSYATPFVAAIAALVRSAHPNLTATQVRRRMELTADHPGTALPDPQVGWGVVNPYNAVASVLPEESGAGSRVGSPGLIAPLSRSTTDNRTRDAAVTFAAGVGVVAVIAIILGFALPRAARRQWQPAGEPTGSDGPPGPGDRSIAVRGPGGPLGNPPRDRFAPSRASAGSGRGPATNPAGDATPDSGHHAGRGARSMASNR